MSQIIIGYTAEGSTDVRFLSGIIERTFIEIAFECSMQIEVFTPVVYIKKQSGNNFEDQLLKCSKEAYEKGIMAFCIHVDADADSDSNVYSSRIEPALQVIKNTTGNVCNNIVPVIPIQMTEAWMLADKQLLKEEIGTEMSDDDLKINRDPESMADPKAVIAEAITIARSHITKRRRNDLTISELYQAIGQKISLEALGLLPSYNKFQNAVRDAYKVLNYLH